MDKPEGIKTSTRRMTDLDHLTDVGWISCETTRQAIGKLYILKYGQCYADGHRFTWTETEGWKKKPI